MTPQLEQSDIIFHLIKSIINVIGRRSSERYAVVMIKAVLTKLTEQYKFLQYISIRGSQYVESEDLITVKTALNEIPSEKIRDAMKNLLTEITISTGQTAGYFFIKELQETLDREYDLALKELGIDLGYLHLQHITDTKPSRPTQAPQYIDIFKRVLQILLSILEKHTTKENALEGLKELIEEESVEFDFLKYITIQDIRLTQADEAIQISNELNQIDQPTLGKALQKLMEEIYDQLQKQGIYTFSDQLKEHLSPRLLTEIKKMDVDIKRFQVSQKIVVKQILQALIEILSVASSQQYAVYAIDTVIKTVDPQYNVLKYVHIDATRYSEGIDAVSVTTNLDDVNPRDLGRAIQKFLESIIKALGPEIGQTFVEELKKNLDQVYLNRLEEMGVNLHMIQLRQELLYG